MLFRSRPPTLTTDRPAPQIPSANVVDAPNGEMNPPKPHPNQPDPRPTHSTPREMVTQSACRLSHLSIPVHSKDWSHHQPSGPMVTIIRKGTSLEDIIPRGLNSGFEPCRMAVVAPQLPSKLPTSSPNWYLCYLCQDQQDDSETESESESESESDSGHSDHEDNRYEGDEDDKSDDDDNSYFDDQQHLIDDFRARGTKQNGVYSDTRGQQRTLWPDGESRLKMCCHSS